MKKTSRKSAIQTPALTRREALQRLLLGALTLGAPSLISAGCGSSGDGDSGTLDNPLTQDAAGDFETGKALRNPVIFGSLVSATGATTPVTRIWIEVMDESSVVAGISVGDVLSEEQTHPSTDDEYVSQIRLVDATTGDLLAAKVLQPGAAPRLVVELDLTGITEVRAYAEITAAGGWWAGEPVATSTLAVAQAEDSYGSFRQALTAQQAGIYTSSTGKKAKHAGRWGYLGSSQVRLVFSGANAEGTQDYIHDAWNPDHYVVGGYLLDQDAQPISGATYRWSSTGSELTTTDTGFVAAQSNGAGADVTMSGTSISGTTENYLTITLPAGVSQARWVWLCSDDGWWETRFDIDHLFSWEHPVSGDYNSDV